MQISLESIASIESNEAYSLEGIASRLLGLKPQTFKRFSRNLECKEKLINLYQNAIKA